MTLVEIYSKEECHLCDRAKAKLRQIQREYPFELREIILREGDAFYEAYGGRVPVIIVDNDVTYEYRVPEEEFIGQLRRRAPGRQ
jgi:glutaredoxin